MSSSLDPVVALGDAWRRARESLTSFSSVRGREVTGTHLLRIGGYSAVESQLPRGKCLESAPFRAGGHRWRLEYFPNGFGPDSTSGCPSVLLRLLDSRFLGSAADATAAYRVAILDGDGNAAYSSAASQRVYSVRGVSGVWVDVEEAKADALRGLKDDCLSLRCDVTVRSVEESRVKCLLRGFLSR